MADAHGEATDRRLTVLVGITGGIAAYKAIGVIRSLVLLGHDVHVVPTESALRFVGLPTLEAISRNPVTTDLYDGVAEVRHVALGQSADLIIVAPATANTLAKLAGGLSDDLLGTSILASAAPVVVAPAMHTGMWRNAATVANLETLRSRGVTVVGPADGQLTGSDTGPGRMSEPDEIVAVALALIESRATTGSGDVVSGDLVGRRILVTAGGTREALDPVRFLGNRSSGRQGVAIARAAAARGADVVLIATNLEVAEPEGVRVIRVESARDLDTVTSAEAPQVDVVVMAAAVADYRPVTIAESKLKKETLGDRVTLELVKNPDILARLSASRPPGQIVIGFAAETEEDYDVLLDLARAKITRKGCDYLVVNRVGWKVGFASDDNTITVVDEAGAIVMEAAGTKTSVADRILDLLV